MKYALVKQDVYQDLYVSNKNEKNPKEILLSSMMRVGPFGLIKDLGADFFIINEDSKYKETQIYKKSLPSLANEVQLLKKNTVDKLSGEEFKKPGSLFPNGNFSINFDSIDWSLYDIVISINCAIPRVEIVKHPETLFCYMIGEANIKTRKPLYGYDVVLLQESSKKINKGSRVNFPYTFLNSNTLESIIAKPKEKKGIFIEINSHIERPASIVPKAFKEILIKTFEEPIFHDQFIKKNLENLSRSKYFIKWGGRKIRGNSLIESISLGTLVIANPSQVIHNDVLVESTACRSVKDIISLVLLLNNNPDEYKRLLNLQKKVLNEKYFRNPISSLIYNLGVKKKKNQKRLNKNFGILNLITFITLKINRFFNVEK